MKATLSTSQATDLLKADTNARWSYSGARALIEHLEQLEEDCGTEIEFDAVAIRCDFSEYDSALEAAIEQGLEFDADEEHKEWETSHSSLEEWKEEIALEWLQHRTDVIKFSGGVIIRSF